MQQLVITILAHQSPHIARSLPQLAAEHNCSVEHSQLATLGQESAITLMVSGNWSSIVKLENVLDQLDAEEGVSLLYRRTEDTDPTEVTLRYKVEAVSVDQPGLIHEIVDFFLHNDVTIDTFHTESFNANRTGATLLSLTMMLKIPATLSILDLRDQFMILCEDLNVDATLKPEQFS